jgi:hypothetical protein
MKAMMQSLTSWPKVVNLLKLMMMVKRREAQLRVVATKTRKTRQEEGAAVRLTLKAAVPTV